MVMNSASTALSSVLRNYLGKYSEFSNRETVRGELPWREQGGGWTERRLCQLASTPRRSCDSSPTQVTGIHIAFTLGKVGSRTGRAESAAVRA